VRREIARSWSSEVAGVQEPGVTEWISAFVDGCELLLFAVDSALNLYLAAAGLCLLELLNSCLTGLPASRIADRGRHLPLGVAF
jgi:hypothetical protein